MEEFKFNSKAYLQRIGYTDDIAVSLESLKSLHNAQFKSIPFENFDICLNRNINLSPSTIFNKLVGKNRGGYCFELNGLLLMALQHYGFEARSLLARVHLADLPTGRSHQASLVSVKNKKWIVDAGFGADTPPEPVPFILDTALPVNSKTIRIIKDDLFTYMLQMKKDNAWVSLYSFDLNHVCDGDITYANYYTSTHPDSRFVCSRVASLPLEDGLVTLVNFKLKKRINGKTTTQELKPGQAYLDALNKYFGIDLEVNYENLNEIKLQSP